MREDEEFSVRILEDDGTLMVERPGKAWSVMLYINRFGIDRVLLRPLHDWDAPFLSAREFGFKPSRIIKNGPSQKRVSGTASLDFAPKANSKKPWNVSISPLNPLGTHMSIKRKENSNRYRPLTREAKGTIFLELGITLSDKDAEHVTRSACQRHPKAIRQPTTRLDE
jgi:hypothetical protein